MDPRQRRRTPAAAARLTALLLANLALLALLWREVGDDVRAWSRRPDGVQQAEPAEAALQELAEAQDFAAGDEGSPAVTTEHPAPLSAAALRRLEGELRRTASRFVEQAVKAFPGRLSREQVTVAVHVREAGAPPSVEAGLRSDASLRPASNMKLLTTAAALVWLGPHWQFETRVEGSGELTGGLLRGDLVVRAAGDPLYDPRAKGSVQHLLAPLVGDLRGRGLAAVEGDLVLDEGSFEDPAPAPAWPDAGQHWTEYCALAGGFSANRGCLTAQVEAGPAGAPARVRVLPEGHGWPEAFQVETLDPRAPLKIALMARAGRVTVRGSLPSNVRSWSDAFAHPDPVELFGHVLRHELERGGIRVLGEVRRERGVAPGTLLGTLRSSLADTLGPINTDSTNAVADQVFLATGLAVEGAGTREAAARASRRAVERLGVRTEGLAQVDGSGLSRDNRASARQIVALLEAVLALSSESASLYLESLAVGGETGTLSGRMRSLPGSVSAKTGFIGGSSALSGFARTPEGRTFVFSILVEYPDLGGLNTSCWKPMQDQMCRQILEAAR